MIRGATLFKDIKVICALQDRKALEEGVPRYLSNFKFKYSVLLLGIMRYCVSNRLHNIHFSSRSPQKHWSFAHRDRKYESVVRSRANCAFIIVVASIATR